MHTQVLDPDSLIHPISDEQLSQVKTSLRTTYSCVAELSAALQAAQRDSHLLRQENSRLTAFLANNPLSRNCKNTKPTDTIVDAEFYEVVTV